MRLYDRIQSFLATDQEEACSEIRRSTITRTREALGVIEQAYQDYNDNELAISYNGGKDCLVLLILLAAFLEHRSPEYRSRKRRIESVYVAIEDPFKEVDDFVASSARDYGLDVVKVQKPMKEAFADYLHNHPSIRAILVGTRRQDPHGSKLTFFDRTDKGWPDFMRVHPIINWNYAEVWDLLRALKIPYCVLYDRGYTSLGGTTDTLPNPALQLSSGVDVSEAGPDPEYRPAWQLQDGGTERLGRDRAKETSREEVSSINHKTTASIDSTRSALASAIHPSASHGR